MLVSESLGVTSPLRDSQDQEPPLERKEHAGDRPTDMRPAEDDAVDKEREARQKGSATKIIGMGSAMSRIIFPRMDR